MTEPFTAYTIGATAVATVVVAVIDPAIQSIALAVIAALVIIIPVWFKYKTDQLNAKMKKQDEKITEVIKTSDGMKDALVRVTGEAKLAEGVEQGVAKEKANQALIDKATAQARQETGSKPPL